MKSLLIILFSLTATTCYAQDNNLQARSAFTLDLAVNDSSIYHDDIKAANYLNGPNILQIYPGETVFIEVELAADTIRSMKTVKENINQQKTIEVTFSQLTKGRMHTGMMLKVVNPFEKLLKYNAQTYLMEHKRWVKTTIYPVNPKKVSFETWPDLITSIALFNWQLVDKG